ncbi:MAG TPA: acyltransferase, partial [Candidatus Marinimicrobia bacterium]|nr:acyltransferase [Candidatus Neomarinimicrobiota bacterium]
LVNKNLEPWSIYVGIPAKYLKPRSKKIIELEHLI